VIDFGGGTTGEDWLTFPHRKLVRAVFGVYAQGEGVIPQLLGRARSDENQCLE
jgi:hypothetical protein